MFMKEEIFFHCLVPLNMSLAPTPSPSYITAEVPFIIYGYQKVAKLSRCFIFLSGLALFIKNVGTRHFKGNSFLRSAQWEAEGDWYLLSAKCFLNTVQYTRKDMVHAPWGYHLNRTDEVRHNWLNSYPVLMTSLWEPKSPSEKTVLFTKP